MGRYTLFPDDLLLTALDNESPFEIVAMMKKGEMIIHPEKDYLRSLLKQR
jgi:hypothetical protein